MFINSLQPTLIKHNSTLNLTGQKGDNLIVKVLDLQGKIAKTLEKELNEGQQELSINLSDLTNGAYILNVFNGSSFIKAIRFLKH